MEDRIRRQEKAFKAEVPQFLSRALIANSCSKGAGVENSRWEQWIHQELVKGFPGKKQTLCTVLRCWHPLLNHPGLVSRRKAAVWCLDKPKPLWFHVWLVLPVTVVIPLLPGGFPSPAFPLPSSVIRAWGRGKHNYRTEKTITQRLRRLHVTDHHRRSVAGKWPFHHLIILTPANPNQGEGLTRSHQSLKLFQLFTFSMWSTKVKTYRRMCTCDRDPKFPGKTRTFAALCDLSTSGWHTHLHPGGRCAHLCCAKLGVHFRNIGAVSDRPPWH